jgi:hypothetical protein
MKAYGAVDVSFKVSLSSALNFTLWSFYPRKNSLYYTFYRVWVGPHSRYRQFAEEGNILTLPEIEYRLPGYVVYNTVTISTELTRLLLLSKNYAQ